MSGTSNLLQTGTPAHLLIVDDELHIRSSLVRALNLLGYCAEGAGSGDEALALLKRNSYDLMVLDMNMPGLSGVEVMQLARQIHPPLLIIILTGHATLENAIASVKLKAVDYLRKPVSVDKVAGTVTQILKKQARWQQKQQLIRVAGEILESLQENKQNLASDDDPTPERFVSVSPVTLDHQNYLVTTGEKPNQIIQLTEGEGTILACLMNYPNQPQSCRELARRAWNHNLHEYEAESIVRPYIFRLRRKLETNPKKPRLICTVRKLGYQFTSAKAE